MFESLTARRPRNRRRQAGSLAIALLTLISSASASLVTGGQLVRALDAEPEPVFFDVPLEAPPPLPPAPLGVQQPETDAEPAPTPDDPPEDHPENHPEVLPELSDAPAIPSAATLAVGHPGGDPSGVAGGDPNGDPHGSAHGVPAGTGTAVHWSELTFRTMVKPSFPRAARAMGLDDVTCRVHLRVDERGRVAEATVSGCPALFHPAVERATQKWRFHPLRVNGVSQPTQVVVPVRFRLTDSPL